MKLCDNDPLIKIVREQLNANPVRVPRQDIQPMLSITKEGKKIKLFSNISDLIKCNQLNLNTVEIKTEVLADSIKLNPTSKVNIENAVRIAEGFLENSTIPSIDLGTVFEKSSKVAFRFENVKKKYYLPASLTNQISGYRLIDDNLALEIGHKNIHLFIIDAIYECADFSWVVDKNNQSKIRLNILSQIGAQLKNKLEIKTGNDFSITFKGVPRTFAFTCFPVFLSSDKKIIAAGYKQGRKLTFNSPGLTNINPSSITLFEEPRLIDIS